MTAINVFRHADRVVMLTDSAFLERDGRLHSPAPKVYAMPHLSAVMAVRGIRALSMMLADFISPMAQSYDELSETMPGKLRDLWRPVKKKWEEDSRAGPGGGDFELVVAGISESSGPNCYALTSTGMNGLRPWERVDLDYAVSPVDGSMGPECVKDLIHRYADSAAISLMLAQRNVRTVYGSSELPICTVGGFIQETIVTRQSISTRVIHRWPDVIGEKIAA